MNKYLKFLIYLAPVIIFVWLVNKHFVLTGNISSDYGFGVTPSIISEIKPSDRVSEPYELLKSNKISQDITSEPVYFDVNIPRKFDTADITLTYDAPKDAIIELGVRKGPNPTDYYFKTIQNYFYGELSEGWNRIDDENLKLTLLQKGEINEPSEDLSYEYTFKDVKEFLNDIPEEKNIATYKFDIYDYLKLDDYQATNKSITINTPIKGDHSILTYIKDEDLEFEFEFDIYDANKIDGPDILRIDLYRGIKLISSDIIEDDENEATNGVEKTLDKYKLYKPGLPEGLYKIVFSGSDDLVINKLHTAQTYLIFKDSISFLDTNKQVSVFAFDDKLKIINSNEETVKASINGFAQEAEDSESIINYDLELSKANRITTSTSNTLSAKYFVFSENHFFDPKFNVTTTPLQHVKALDSLDYVIMPLIDYETPKKSSNKFVKTINFDVGDAYTDRGPMEFILSIPSRDKVTISDLSVSLDRSPIWENFFPRLINKFNGN